MRTGILYLVSGPSGSGKSTLCRRLESEGEVEFSVSCTSRQPREGEIDGNDYYFIDKTDFLERVQQGQFIEHALVHNNYYGTLHSEVIDRLERGIDVVMDIDVQGATLVRASENPLIRKALLDLFVMPPDERELEARLRQRGTDSEEVIQLRLHNAIQEISHWPEYRYRLISTTREEDYTRFKALLIAERMRTAHLIKKA